MYNLADVRAVLRDTEVLILDEATSSLDLETGRQVQDSLDRLRRNRTTIIIAHRLSDAILSQQAPTTNYWRSDRLDRANA